MKRVVQVVFVFMLLISILSQLMNVDVQEGDKGFSDTRCRDKAELDSLSGFGLLKRIQRSWKDPYVSDDYCVQYQVSDNEREQSNQFRERLPHPRFRTDGEYWGKVYAQLFNNDRERLRFLEDSLRVVIESNGMDETEAVFYVVSMVQDIPYHYIMDESCQGFNDHPCVSYQRFGLLSPVEFLYRLSGDCDTRTVLLYTLLSNLGFQSVILNSVEYGHSMLGVNIPTSGGYVEHRGQRYYFWETTATGWGPGMLPPDMNNINYWNVVLD